jgi:hypothetical protein
MEDLGLEKGQIWRVDPHLPNPVDVEILGSGSRGTELAMFVRSVLPGGFVGKETRPVMVRDFVRHAVLLCEPDTRREYDSGDWREPFVR